MQVAQLLSLPSTTYDPRSSAEYAEVSGELSELKLDEDFGNGVVRNGEVVENDVGGDQLKEEEEEDEGGCGESDGDDDFSFACLNPDGSTISTDDVFFNGQIAPVFPIFNRNLLFSEGTDVDSAEKEVLSLRPPITKVFVEKRNTLSSSKSEELAGVEAGTYCEWSRKTAERSPELCKKSNSTGFSKLWRFKELVHHRSNSDGKDAFVFFNNPSSSSAGKSNKEVSQKKEKIGEERRSGSGKIKAKEKEAVRGKTSSSIHDRPYAGVRSRGQKEGIKRKSYLPYRQDLVGVGFFTNVNGLTRNVHPF